MLRHQEVYVGLVLLLAAQFAIANDGQICSLIDTPGATVVERVTNMSAGKVTAGKPITLYGLVGDPASHCLGDSCVANGGVAGVELWRIGDRVCVGLPGKGKLGTTSGWLPAVRWESHDSAPQPNASWVGVWQNQSAKISVEGTAVGKLAVEGHALWVGGALKQPHFGEFEATGAQNGGVISTIEGDSCQVAVRLIGDFLVAADNNSCGGMNVRFDGLYRLRHR